MHAFFDSVKQIAASDLALLRRFPRYAIAVLVIALVPALYALIYLSSVWDPNANTRALPVAIVNLDAGLQYQGRSVHLGTELTRGLMAMGSFGFRPLASVDAARSAVRRGELAFAIVIPADFSANAVPGALPGAGKVTVILSEGNNYASAGFARRFAEDLGHQANEILNEQRWEQVLAKADGSGRSLDDLRFGMSQLQAGLQELEADIGRHTTLDRQWADGVRQAETELRRLEVQWQADADILPLRSGIGRLLERQRQLTSSLEPMRLAIEQPGGRDAEEQESRATTVAPTDGLHVPWDNSKRIGEGLMRADARVGKLVDGLGGLSESLHGVDRQLQRAAALESPSAGGKALASSVARLRMGVEMAGSMLPASTGKLDGSARGLAESVEPVLEVMAPVANNGSAFAPNMVAMALWLGAVMVVYVFAMQAVPQLQARPSRLALITGKFIVPAAVTVAQVGLIFATLTWALGIRIAEPVSFSAIAVLSGWAFLAMVLLLVRAFGEAGKLLAVLLLTLQLAAGGGVLPIELSGDLFRSMHDWLPFTWVVRALRASLFGAFDGNWLLAATVVVGGGMLAWLAAAFVGRWTFVPQHAHRPPIDV